MAVANQDVRTRAKEAGVKMWQIAERYGIADCNFSRKLRRELPAEVKQKIFGIITEISEEAKANA